MSTQWVSDFYRDVDAFRIELLEAWFTDQVDLRFGNNPPILGKAGAIEALTGFYASIGGLQHKRESMVASGQEAVQQAIVTYTRLDGRRVPLPVSSYLRRDGSGKLDRLWIYIDIHPLYAESGAA